MMFIIAPSSSSLQHQGQVAVAVERAKQITMAELNAVMQVFTIWPGSPHAWLFEHVTYVSIFQALLGYVCLLCKKWKIRAVNFFRLFEPFLRTAAARFGFKRAVNWIMYSTFCQPCSLGQANLLPASSKQLLFTCFVDLFAMLGWHEYIIQTKHDNFRRWESC